MPPDRRHRILLALALLSAFVLAYATYGDMLGYGLTASDTLPLIQSGRIQSWGDVARILGEPLLGGTAFVERAGFYRPVSTLSFAMDHALWRLDPFGYQLTDLLLHMLVTGLVFLLVYRLAAGQFGTACLAAWLFTIHPILVESVPAISRRQDILATLFLILALLALDQRVRTGNRRWTAVALLANLLALGAKEIAVVLPALALGYGMVLASTGGLRDRWRRGWSLMRPYLIATIAFVGWRAVVLGDLGGIRGEGWGRGMFRILRDFVRDLAYPGTALPLTGQRLLSQAAPYAIALAGLVIVLILILQLGLRRRSPASQAPLAFFLCWLPSFLALFMLTQGFDHRSMYAVAVPFSAALALLATEGWRRLQAARFRPPPAAALRSAVPLVMISILVIQSPLLRDYAGWKDSAALCDAFFRQLAPLLTDVGDDTVLHLHGLPPQMVRTDGTHHRIRTVSFLSGYAIKAWLDLHRPGNEMAVVLHERARPADLDCDLQVVRGERSDGQLHVYVTWLGSLTSGPGRSSPPSTAR